MRLPLRLLGTLLGIVLLASGCATHAVWGIKDYFPADKPNVSLAFSPKNYDILVRYDQERVSFQTKPETKAYWLFAYSDNPPKGDRPVFIGDTNSSELAPIPVTADIKTPVPESGYCARLNYGGPTSFDLYRNGVCLGRFWLPIYSTPAQPANARRILLTPPAAIADTAIVGAFLGAMGLASGGWR